MRWLPYYFIAGVHQVWLMTVRVYGYNCAYNYACFTLLLKLVFLCLIQVVGKT